MPELSFRGVDLRRADRTVRYWITQGWVDDVPDVRGVDTVVPAREGRTIRNRVKDRRVIILNGRIQAATEAEMFELLQEMGELWDTSLSPGTLSVSDEYKGVPASEAATIEVRTVSVVSAFEFAFLQKQSVELECVDNPPDWTVS